MCLRKEFGRLSNADAMARFVLEKAPWRGAHKFRICVTACERSVIASLPDGRFCLSVRRRPSGRRSAVQARP